MTRRKFLCIAATGTVLPASAAEPVIVPIHQVLDRQAKIAPQLLQDFWSSMWPEAVRDFQSCGIRLQISQTDGRIERPPYRQPVISGLERSAINLVITDRIPMQWDNGRALNGVTTRYRGYHLCMVALNRAQCHKIPLLSVNTCVHELLHALLHDIFESRPNGFAGQAREFRVDLYATWLWLFRGGPAIREAARAYVERLRSEPAA